MSTKSRPAHRFAGWARFLQWIWVALVAALMLVSTALGTQAFRWVYVGVLRPLRIVRPILVILTFPITIVTLGIWTLVWSYQNGEEMKRHNGTGMGGGLYLLFTFLLAPVIVSFHQGFELFGKIHPFEFIHLLELINGLGKQFL